MGNVLEALPEPRGGGTLHERIVRHEQHSLSTEHFRADCFSPLLSFQETSEFSSELSQDARFSATLILPRKWQALSTFHSSGSAFFRALIGFQLGFLIG